MTAGNRADVFETALGSIGMILCYDGDFPELSRLLAVKGAEIIVRPSALLRSFDIWYITNAARAYDNHVYVVATPSPGAWPRPGAARRSLLPNWIPIRCAT